jgi:hypothetical protein
VSDVLEFLLSRFREGIKYRTVTVYVSALSARLRLGSKKFSEYDEVKKFVSACFHERPPEVRIYPSWQVESFFQLCRSWWPLSSLSLEQLTHKTVMLVALAFAARTQTLTSLSVDPGYCVVSDNAITFRLRGLQKGSRPRSLKQVVALHRFHDPQIDPYAHCLEYVRVVQPLRLPDTGALFLQFAPPHRAALARELASWLCEVIASSMPTPSNIVPTAHLVRATAATTAYANSASLSTIMSSACWSNAEIFYRHYRIADSAGDSIIEASRHFQSAVLSHK